MSTNGGGDSTEDESQMEVGNWLWRLHGDELEAWELSWDVDTLSTAEEMEVDEGDWLWWLQYGKSESWKLLWEDAVFVSEEMVNSRVTVFINWGLITVLTQFPSREGRQRSHGCPFLTQEQLTQQPEWLHWQQTQENSKRIRKKACKKSNNEVG